MNSKDILADLNPEQKQAVTTSEGPLLIIAGAGTGKTAVIARRIAYIIEKKLAKPSEILALTFTDKAAGEMEERVDILVPYGFIDTTISTFHALGDRILRDNAFDFGLSPDFKVLSRPQQVLFFQQNLFHIPLDYWRPLSNPTKFISAILAFFSRLKDENITPKEFLRYVKSQKSRQSRGSPKAAKVKSKEERIEFQKYQELAGAFESYERFKDEAGFLDFGDQVVKTIELFQKRPKILSKYQEQFKYILVDEYQDTNYAQNELVKILARKHKNICVDRAAHADGLGARLCVADHDRAGERGHGQDRAKRVGRLLVEDQDAEEHGQVRVAVHHGIEERAVVAVRAGEARHRAVEEVEEPRHREQRRPPAQAA